MMVTTLLCLILLASVWQPSPQRLFAALVTSVALLCRDWGYAHADGLLYYGSAAAIDLLIIAALSRIRPIPKMALRLQVICAASITLNLAGFAAWWQYHPPTLYNTASIALYSWILITMVRRGSADDVGVYAPSSRNSSYNFPFSTCVFLDKENGGSI